MGEEEADGSTDIEGEAPEEDTVDGNNGTRRRVICWHGRDEPEIISEPAALRLGDVIVIPASVGGWTTLGDLAPGMDGKPVLDWGDRAFRTLRARAVLRLHRDLIATWPVTEKTKTAVLELIANAKQRLDEDPDGLIAELRDLLRDIVDETVPPAWSWLPEVAGSLAAEARKMARNVDPHPFGGLILRGKRLLPAQVEHPDTFSDEHDSTASGTVAVPLVKHLPGVAEFARRFAEGAGLREELITLLELAGRLHDLGKADPRFQGLLRGGQRFIAGELLAKSGDIPQGRNAYEQARKAAGYPAGGRHELLSVCLAESVPDILPANDALRELLLHLVASHHGYCRPFAPVIEDEKSIEVRFELFGKIWSHSSVTRLERLDSGVSDRFWTLLRRHGWWGSAWFETVLRLADHRRSEWEQEHAGGQDDA